MMVLVFGFNNLELITVYNSENLAAVRFSVPKSSIIRRFTLNKLSYNSLDDEFFWLYLYSKILSKSKGEVWYNTVYPFFNISLAIQPDRNVLPTPGVPVNNKFFCYNESKFSTNSKDKSFILLIFSLGEMFIPYLLTLTRLS